MTLPDARRSQTGREPRGVAATETPNQIA